MIFAGKTYDLPVEEPSQVGDARRAATALAEAQGFDEAGRGRVALLAAEAATNLHKHAKGGRLVLRALDGEPSPGVELLAIDAGPGMVDPARCLSDGFSTAGSPGNGLGALFRLASRFDLYSSPRSGTVVLCRIFARESNEADPRGLDVGVVSLPLAGEELNGDSWAVDHREDRSLVMVVDGLGHGIAAHEAARAAVEVFGRHRFDPPDTILSAAHEGLRHTRGAAMAVVRLDHERREAIYAGVGNIAGVILSPNEDKSASMVSYSGTVGHSVRKVQQFTYAWPKGSILAMHSDGLSANWRVDRYPGLSSRSPAVIAAVLHRDFRRVRDDATVLVAAEKG